MVKSAFALAGLAVLTFAATANAQPNRRDYDRYFEVCDTGTQAQRLRCARNELSDSDRRLNIIYQRMLADANRVDTRERRQGYRGWYSQADALRNAQRAWIAMRDSDCRFVTQPDVGRRRALELSTTLCRADRTSQRVEQLEDMRDSLREMYGS